MGQAYGSVTGTADLKEARRPRKAASPLGCHILQITTTQEITVLVAHRTASVNLFSFVSALDQSRLRRGATVVHAKTSLNTSAGQLGLTTTP